MGNCKPGYQPEEEKEDKAFSDICFIECVSCNDEFDMTEMKLDDDSNYYCDECYEVLAPVMQEEFDNQKDDN